MGSFSLFQWAILAVVVFGIYSMAKSSGSPSAGGKYHCMMCGTDGPGTNRTRGSIFIEIVLWLCFIIPGVIYSIWRLTTRRNVCGTCGSEQIVPYAAPAAINHRRQLQGEGQAPAVERTDWK